MSLRYVQKLVNSTVVAGVVYLGGMLGIQTIANSISPKIQSQTRLEQLLEQEKKKIDHHNTYKIYPKLLAKNEGYSRKLGNFEYEIVIGGSFATETVLRHELYHILDGHCDNSTESDFKNGMIYLFWNEPQATIYQTTGIKL